jgi:glutamyl-tRNA reductase
MSLILSLSLNYRSSPVEVREKLSFTGERLEPGLRRLAERLPDCEVVILSTCNRTEIYLACPHDDQACLIEDAALNYLAEHAHISGQALLEVMQVRSGEAAAHHLLRVAAGLDSLVTGENEILGQVKDAYGVALQAGTCGAVLAALLRSAIQAGKRARAQAGVGQARQSVASVVVALARQTFAQGCEADLSGRTALMIGAGKISAMTARLLVQAGLRCVLVANRTFDRAVKLAEGLGGQAVHFDCLGEHLSAADIVICSTGAPHTVLHLPTVQQAMLRRPQRPLLIADLAVPRDVDPQVAELPNVRLADIDDLEELAAEMLPLSAAAVQQAEQVVCEELALFNRWLDERHSAARIAALQAKADEVCRIQLKKTLRRLPDLTDEQEKALQAMAHAIASQIMAEQIKEIKQHCFSTSHFT